MFYIVKWIYMSKVYLINSCIISIYYFYFVSLIIERQGKNPAYNTSRKWFDLCYDIKGDEIRLLDRAIDREYYQLHYIYSKFYPLHVDDDLQSKNF